VGTDKIDIILPNRIGDTILTLPAIFCLKQLQEKYGADDVEYKLVTYLPLTEILQSLNLFKVIQINFKAKMNSWLAPADKAFFLSTTSKNIGYRSRISHGLRMPNKKHIRYSFNLPYLRYPVAAETLLPEELVDFLKSGFGFSGYTIRHFGLCLELGYTVEQIRQTFRFDRTNLSFSDVLFDWKPPVTSKYLVFCMEAASKSKKVNADRRWKEEHFFDLAEIAYRKYGKHAAFIGVNDIPELPDRPYFIDFRQKLNLKKTALLLHYSDGYVGNDTGPLHLANLMGKRSIGMYFREDAVINYAPLFPQLNTIFLRPRKPDEIYDSLDELVLG
jgi:ADP-heptose:LPS heptosyltransferase